MLTNLQRVLEAAGADLTDVLKLTWYVTDAAHISAMLAVRDRFIAPQHLPASTVVQVAALFRPDLLLEVDALALLPTGEETR